MDNLNEVLFFQNESIDINSNYGSFSGAVRFRKRGHIVVCHISGRVTKSMNDVNELRLSLLQVPDGYKPVANVIGTCVSTYQSRCVELNISTHVVMYNAYRGTIDNDYIQGCITYIVN